MNSEKLVNDFVADFKVRYKGRRVLKTAYHFMNWVSGFNVDTCTKNLGKFDEYCRKKKVRATWRNAAEWYAIGKVAEK